MATAQKKAKKVDEMSSVDRMVAANTPLSPQPLTEDVVVTEYLNGETTPEEAVAKLHAVQESKPEPGSPDFDWQEEYPGEEVFVYTVPATAKKSPGGKQSPVGMTIGLARLTEDRAPNPGQMQDAYEAGGFAPMWLFIGEVSSPASRKLQKLLRPPEYNEMLRGWAKFAGIELSE